jgi:hypothetical protein
MTRHFGGVLGMTGVRSTLTRHSQDCVVEAGHAMAQSTLRHPRAVMSELRRNYQMTDEEEIRAFLERYPAVAPILSDIRSNIRRFFGEDPVMLKVSHDLDWEDDQPELFAHIQTRLDPQEALARLEAFDTEWWLKRRTEANAPLVVSLHLI